MTHPNNLMPTEEKSPLRCLSVGRPSGSGSFMSMTFNRPISEDEWKFFRDRCLSSSFILHPDGTEQALADRLGDVLDIIAAAEMHFAQTEAHHEYYTDCFEAVKTAKSLCERAEKSA